MELEYRGEGSAAMVFALTKSNEVLRLIKSNTVDKIRKDIRNGQIDKSNLLDVQMAVKEQLANVIDYMRNIMQPLFSNQFVVVPTLTKVPHGFTDKAVALTRHERPDHRKNASGNSLDADIQWAFVLRDCCFVHDKKINFDSNIQSSLNCNAVEGRFDLATFLDTICKSDPFLLSPSFETDSSELRTNKDYPNIQESLLKCGDLSGHGNSNDSQDCQAEAFKSTSRNHSLLVSSGNSVIVNGKSESDGDNITVPGKVTSIGLGGNADSSRLSSVSKSEKFAAVSKNLHHSDRDFTLSFEIKPKKAYMLPKASGEEGRAQVCKFCMHQCLKVSVLFVTIQVKVFRLYEAMTKGCFGVKDNLW
ncbi:inositol-pentakisphosphate 2-kinase [Elysia marginata]|uniref:Inositol-pentakisphosphate 2-kinase n=1 Tax=Elysia marginata TaxID=1093978 RepID=A0AAV4F9B8_9GAST|nr:inositol-pentakisphosphate 2-kinase [Elysia marginata]